MIWKSDPNCPGRHSPKQSAFADCLKLLLSINFLVIIALTDRLEKGKQKCHDLSTRI